MVMNTCPNCNYELKSRYIGSRNNPSKLKCPKCRKNLEITKKSAISYLLITIVPMLLAVFFIGNSFIRIGSIILWLLLSLRLLRPVIYRYQLEKK